ncbi:transcriptional regulator, partial [Mesorhizobium sp. M8A.F.Ca.ET.165.01.1.1]
DTPPFQPASYLDIPPPEREGAITIIGRVKRSMIDM